ncbi:MAG: hypothetical protein GC156_12820 [Actinomycetales bacterium]|nr:hypothetical protein [Actinomycetales bacterium]
MTAFDEATTLVAVEQTSQSATFVWDVPDGWQQGRGAWGGLAVGAIVGAVVRAEPDPSRSVRSVSMQISAPVLVGRHQVVASAIRVGRGMSTWEVSVTDADGARVSGGTVITGSARSGSAERAESGWSPLRMPEVPPADHVPALPTGPPFPTFTQHCEYRVSSGLPLQGGEGETLGWISYRDAPTWADVPLLALVDAWYTVTLVPLADLVPVGTVTFTANLLVDPRTIEPGAPLLHHGLITASRDGYVSELRRLWTPDGRLAVENLQTVVVG